MRKIYMSSPKMLDPEMCDTHWVKGSLEVSVSGLVSFVNNFDMFLL